MEQPELKKCTKSVVLDPVAPVDIREMSRNVAPLRSE